MEKTRTSETKKQFLIPVELTRKEYNLLVGASEYEYGPIKIGTRLTHGILIPVSESVYREHMREMWREEKETERSNRCMVKSEKTHKLVRCNGNCSECKFTKSGSPLSLERFTEVGYEPGMPTKDDISMLCDAMDLEKGIEHLNELDPRLAQVFMCLYDAKTTREIAEIVGVSQSYVRELIVKARTEMQIYYKFK